LARQQQCKVIYEGEVQGVGFRYTTVRIAQQFQIFGYVRNLRDGSVELLVEGEQSEVNRFLNTLAETMSSYIADIKLDSCEATGEYRQFNIRF